MNLFEKNEGQLIDDLYAHWEKHGEEAIERLCREDPAAYFRIMAAIVMRLEEQDQD
jgi:hypothetical protein